MSRSGKYRPVERQALKRRAIARKSNRDMRTVTMIQRFEVLIMQAKLCGLSSNEGKELIRLAKKLKRDLR